jgi:hypothetical protein
MGGKVEYDYKETAWTGGKPNYDWTGLANPKGTKKSPDCWRQADPVHEAKAHSKLTTPLTNEKQFELDLAEPTLSAFAKRVKMHMEMHGMDSIFYVEDPTRPKEMISVLENYQLCTAAHVTAEIKRVTPLYDEYDANNHTAARVYLRASFGPKLLAKLDARDPKDLLAPAEMFMIAASQGTSISPQEIDIIKKKMKELSPLDFAGQNISDYCTAIRRHKLDLDNAGAYEQSITSQIMLQLNKVTVETFRIHVTIEKEQVDKTLRSAQGLAQADQLVKMTTADHTLELLLMKYEEKYTEMMKIGLWDPAKNKVDKKALATISPGSTPAEINAYITQKVSEGVSKIQSKFDKYKKEQEKNEGTPTKDGKTDTKEKKCFACGKFGHFKGEGKCKAEDIAALEKDRKYPPMPGPNDPKEVMWKGKMRYFCSKCGRNGLWTLKHTTETHVDDFKKKESKTEVSNFRVSDNEDEEVGRWQSVQW